MEDIQKNQDNLSEWLQSDPDHIIDECGDILSLNQFKELNKLSDATEKTRGLLGIILEGGKETCQKFYDILKKEQQRYDGLWMLFRPGGPAAGSVFADGGSVVTAWKIDGLDAKSLSIVVQTPSSSREGSLPGRVKTPKAVYTACDNSVICADTITGAKIDGPVTFSVIQTPPAGPAEQKLNTGPNSLSAQPSPPSSAPHEDKLPFFKRNFSKLVQKVKNVDAIVDELQSGSYHPEMASKVYAADTPESKMRKLLLSTTTREAADALFRATQKHQPEVMRELR